MNAVKRKRWLFSTIVILILIAVGTYFCGKPKPPEPRPKAPERVALNSAERYDLERDEAHGGHTLQRHIGKTDAELHERLEKESISTDSTYTDRSTAEMAVAAAVRENREKIQRWLHRLGGHSNLVLDYDSTVPLGKSMRRDDAQSFPCSHAVVILKWISAEEYYVLTSYPECWRPK
jgi:hypothetical protein